MNGWILKTLHPNIYGNHNWIYYKIEKYYELGLKSKVDRMRFYICKNCGQELSMRCSFPRLISLDDPKINDCNEAMMTNALE